MNRVFFSFLFLLSLLALQAQTINFNIMKGDDNIGKITAIKNRHNYNVTSKASFKIVWKYVRETVTKVSFNGIDMVSSNSTLSVNKEIKDHRVTTKKGTLYYCSKKPENETFSLNHRITYCTSMLYFKEPKNEKKVFAESYQQLCKLELISTGIYKLYLPGGKINHYVYKNGKLEEIRVFRTIVDLVFKRAR